MIQYFRTFATFMKQWPADDVNVQVTSPKLDYDEYFTDELNKTWTFVSTLKQQHR